MSFARQNPLLVFLIHMTQSIMLRQIAYLKAENAVLRSRCAKNIQTTPAERALLVRLGKPLGNAIHELLSLVHYKTFQRWVRDEAKLLSEKALQNFQMLSEKICHSQIPLLVSLKKMLAFVSINSFRKLSRADRPSTSGKAMI